MNLDEKLKPGARLKITFEGGRVVRVKRMRRVAKRVRVRFVGGQVVSGEEVRQ